MPSTASSLASPLKTDPQTACHNNPASARHDHSGNRPRTYSNSTAKDRHEFYDYHCTIAAGSTIDGVEVRLDAKVDGTTGGPEMCVELSWDGGTSWTGTKITFVTVLESTYFLGSIADTWGRTWAVSDFSDANFRVRITNLAASTARDFELDWVAVQIAYTPP